MNLRTSRNDLRTAEHVMAATGGNETAAEEATPYHELLRQADNLVAVLFADVAHKSMDTSVAHNPDTLLGDDAVMGRMRPLARLLALAVMRNPYYSSHSDYSDFGSGHPVLIVAVAQARRAIAWAICDYTDNPSQSRYSTAKALMDIGRFV